MGRKLKRYYIEMDVVTHVQLTVNAKDEEDAKKVAEEFRDRCNLDPKVWGMRRVINGDESLGIDQDEPIVEEGPGGDE